MLKKLMVKALYLVCCGILLGVAVLSSGYRFAHEASAADPSAQRVIYLTFDDGPSCNTAAVLAVLEKYDVKATFFVTAQFEEYLPLLADEDAAGHIVAPHSASHTFSKIYKSSDAFWADQKKINDIIFRYTAERHNIMRFAGGSSNTVSFPYGGRGIMKSLVKECNARGITYYDWTVDSGDWKSNRSAQSIYNTVMRGVKNCLDEAIVILFHDAPSAPHTAEALDMIIAALLEQDYTFGTLNRADIVCHHGMP